MLDLSKNHDGYHTFEELYECRHVLYMSLVNNNKSLFTKNKDYKDWFCVVGDLGTGQISFHIPEKYWKMFLCEEKTHVFDGHNTKQVIERLLNYANKMGEIDAKV